MILVILVKKTNLYGSQNLSKSIFKKIQSPKFVGIFYNIQFLNLFHLIELIQFFTE